MYTFTYVESFFFFWESILLSGLSYILVNAVDGAALFESLPLLIKDYKIVPCVVPQGFSHVTFL